MKRFTYLLIFFAISFLISCNDDDSNAYPLGETTGVNDFVWKGLNSWYYWKPDVPYLQDEVIENSQQYSNLMNVSSPENLFYNLLNDYPNTDRFSWIVDDVDALIANFSGVQQSNGMHYSLAVWDENAGTVLGIVTYVVPNSSAENQGVERGDVFFGINGQPLTTSNYRDLLENNIQVTFAENVSVNNQQIHLSGEVSIPLVQQELEENPIHFYTYYRNGNHITAYLVYNGYKANYNDELNEVFDEFAAQGVTDLILDLRYNSGGSLTSAMGISQMITGQFTGSPFTVLKYNERHARFNETISFSNELKLYDYQNGNLQPTGTTQTARLNLNKLYVLTSGSTASASELTISCLDPYIDVVQIGGRTYGKFVGSITLFDDVASDFTSYADRKRTHNYAMQPIVFSYLNSNNQSFNQGISPDYNINFGDYIGTLGSFGERSDPALSKALDLIEGNTQRVTSQHINLQEIGSNKTLQKFGTELYLDEGVSLQD